MKLTLGQHQWVSLDVILIPIMTSSLGSGMTTRLCCLYQNCYQCEFDPLLKNAGVKYYAFQTYDEFMGYVDLVDYDKNWRCIYSQKSFPQMA